MKKIIFYSSVSNKIGFGHLIRDCALAEFYKKKGFECILAVDNKTNLKLVKRENFKKIIKIKWSNQINTAKRLIKNYRELNCNYLVLDHKFVNQSFQKILKNNEIKWLEFENSKKITFLSNQLLFQNLKKNLKKSKRQKIYTGENYIILRPEFYEKRIERKMGIFVCFGGAKNLPINKTIYKILTEIKTDRIIYFVINNKDIYEKINKINTKKKYTTKIKVIFCERNISRIMDKCDIAICSSGMISHEINSRGLVMLIVSLAKNQNYMLKKWRDYGHDTLGVFNNNNYNRYKKKIINFIKRKLQKKKLSKLPNMLGINEIVADSIKIIKK